MNRPLRSTTAVSIVILSSIIAGCAAPHARSSFAGAMPVLGKVDPNAAFATRALAALNANNVPVAIELAEKAVAKSPMDSGVRSLLGNAYFAGGRFRSAEGAFNDLLTLDPDQPQVVLKMALVQIAQGKDREAVAFLNSARNVLDPSDYGLALALAGRPKDGIAVLDPAARRSGADATVRQNLALAHALAGDWAEARTIAAQDVPAGQLDARIHQWMQLASPQRPADQVAALVGVTPAAVDAGEPVQLALNKVDTQVAVAQAASHRAGRSRRSAPGSGCRCAAAQPAPCLYRWCTSRSRRLRRRRAVRLQPLRPPRSAAPRRCCRRSSRTASPRRPRGQRSSTGRSRRRLVPRNAQTVVQLGAYFTPERVLTAWNGVAKKYGALKAYTPMSARFQSAKGTFYRLSVRGFNSVGEANAPVHLAPSAGGQLLRPQLRGRRAGPVRLALTADEQLQAGHPDGDAHFDLKGDERALRIVGDPVRRSRRRGSSGRDASLPLRRGGREPFGRQSVAGEILAGPIAQFRLEPLALDSKHHHHVGAGDRLVDRQRWQSFGH